MNLHLPEACFFPVSDRLPGPLPDCCAGSAFHPERDSRHDWSNIPVSPQKKSWRHKTSGFLSHVREIAAGWGHEKKTKLSHFFSSAFTF